jgi:hypothetical protein
VRIEQSTWSEPEGWRHEGEVGGAAQLALVFASRAALERPELVGALRERHPAARLLGCTTAGEIAGTRVRTGSLVSTALRFERTRLALERVAVESPAESRAAGTSLALRLDPAGLRHVLVLSDGLGVNGSELVTGLRQGLDGRVSVTGGLAGDGERFERTLVLGEEGARPGEVLALVLYGEELRVGYGSLGGWSPFGPLRTVTRSAGNVLHELDGRPALALYERYLGEHAAGLPATGLLFPLCLALEGAEREVVRTILAVDPEQGSMTFAGDVPEGARARLMRAGVERLIEGAEGAARAALAPAEPPPELAILISCVGRRLVLKQRVEEEVEAVRRTLGGRPAVCGFYSYGEISPFVRAARCELHNQTMSVTTLSESGAHV